MPSIKVHEKALAHLSRGLYRSPASALRELVSNAWDANATYVRIDTNYPNFYQLTIEDNGDGFTKEEFTRLMNGGIGNSLKRPKNLKLKYGRPLIGRLGIGMLGIAQLCGAFTIVSKTKRGSGFRARVHLYDLLKEKLDKDSKDVVKKSKDPNDQPYQEVDVGVYDFEDFAAESYKQGTMLIADDVHPTFIKTFRDSLDYEDFREPPLDWTKALDIVARIHSLQQLGDYWRLLWELSASCPIPYVGEDALPEKLAKPEHDRLTAYNFRLLVDGIDLRKPIHLRNNPNGYSTWPIPVQEKVVYGRTLKFHGYILVQEGQQLRPDELRGILIRIKDVGVGYYDISLLDYRFNEGPRSRWVTGEIFVEEGLEDALNVDRDSFNRFHPQFRTIQQFIHELLRERVFPETYTKIDVRSKAKHEEKTKARASHLQSLLETTARKPVKVVENPSRGNVADKAKLKVSSGSLAIQLPTQNALKTKKTNRHLASAILAIFELSMNETSAEQRRETFTKLLLDLLSKW